MKHYHAWSLHSIPSLHTDVAKPNSTQKCLQAMDVAKIVTMTGNPWRDKLALFPLPRALWHFQVQVSCKISDKNNLLRPKMVLNSSLNKLSALQPWSHSLFPSSLCLFMEVIIFPSSPSLIDCCSLVIHCCSSRARLNCHLKTPVEIIN